MSRILDNGYVKITTLIGVVSAVVAFSVKDAQHKLRVEFAITHLSSKVDENSKVLEALNDKIVGRSPGGWHRDTMERWAAELDHRNPGLKVPDPWDKDYDPRPQ